MAEDMNFKAAVHRLRQIRREIRMADETEMKMLLREQMQIRALLTEDEKTAIALTVWSEQESCANCRFFWASGIRNECRRRAPSHFVVTNSEGGETMSTVISGWPMTNTDDWCGDYEWNREEGG